MTVTPRGVSEYSTLGGTWVYTFLLITPSCSSSRNCFGQHHIGNAGNRPPEITEPQDTFSQEPDDQRFPFAANHIKRPFPPGRNNRKDLSSYNITMFFVSILNLN